MLRLILRKGALFAMRAQGPRLHPPLAPPNVPTGAHGNLVLVPSKDNPGVRRWQLVGAAPPAHDEHGRRLLNEIFDSPGGTPLTRARAERPGIRALELHGLVEFQQEPEHHAYEFRAVLTAKGKDLVRKQRADAAAAARRSQTTLFKAGRGAVGAFMRSGLGQRPTAPATPEARPKEKAVRFRHPETGEERTGDVHAGGAKGISVIDHETGLLHRVPHGHYVADPNAGKGPPASQQASPKPGTLTSSPKRAKPEGSSPDYRESHPGLNRYPPAGVEAEEGKPADGWALRWKGEDGKEVHGWDRAKLRGHGQARFGRLADFGTRLERLRSAIQAHIKASGTTRPAVLAGLLALVDRAHVDPDEAPALLKRDVKVDGDTVRLDYESKHGHVRQELRDPQLAGLINRLLKLPGKRLAKAVDHRGDAQPIERKELDSYVRTHAGGKHDAGDLRTFHASRLFAEEHDKLGARAKGEHVEARVRHAAGAAAGRMGYPPGHHTGRALLDRHVDPTVVEAHRQGLTLSGKLHKGEGAPPATGLDEKEAQFMNYLRTVREKDPCRYHRADP